MKKIIIFIIFFSVNSFAQKVLISGIVKEKETQEKLIGVNIINSLNNTIVGSSDDNGYYNLLLTKGKNKLTFSYMGYKSILLNIDLMKDTIIDITLESIMLSELVVSDNNINMVERIGTTSIPIQQIKNIPAILGESDVLRALTVLPGVSNGTEGSVGLNVRGGSPDQNLILIDGATVYNATHLFGFFSSFNTDVIKKVELVKSDYSAKYGGRLSSVIDVTFKDGNKERHTASGEVGLIAMKLNLEGPILKNKISYMVGMRSSYLNLLNSKNKRDYQDTVKTNYRTYNFYDINAKISILTHGNGSLTFSFFKSADYFLLANILNNKRNEFSNQLNWNTTVGSVKFFQTFSKKVTYNTTLAYNRYYYDYNLNFRPISPNADDKLDLTYNSATLIHDLSFKHHFDYILNPLHRLYFGSDFIYQNFTPNITSTKINSEVKSNGRNPLSNQNLNFFIGTNSLWTEKISSHVGLRRSSYFLQNKNYSFFEPHISIAFDIDKTSAIKASFDVMNQAVHLLSNNTVGFTNDAWLPSTDRVAPQNALQYSIGYGKNFKKKVFCSIEMYYKKLSNLIDYTEGTNPILDNATKQWQDIIQKNGNGKAYGIEFLLRKDYGKFNGIFEYTFSKSLRKFLKINDGNWYPSRFDRTSDLGLTTNYSFSKRWSFSSNIVYSTGTPFTGGRYVYADRLNQENINAGVKPIQLFYSSKNNLRLPEYKRVDMSVAYKNTSKKKVEHQVSIGAFNLSNRYNPIAATQNISENGTFDANNKFVVDSYKIGFIYTNLLRIIPFINYNVKLK